MKIDVTKPKFFQFNVNIDGIDYQTLKGKLEFFYENVSYGFPVKIYKDRVEVEIPALQNVIKKRIEESDEMNCMLEIFGEGFHLEPWKSNIDIMRSAFIDASNPVVEDKGSNFAIEEIALSKNSDEIRKNKKHLLDEDAQYLKKLKSQLSHQDNVIKQNELLVEKFDKNIKQNSKIDNKKFNKKDFIEKISIIEEQAVINNISFTETSKNDTPEQKRIRKKVRKIFQEAFDKKQKEIQQASKSELITETKKEKFDINNVTEINKDTVIQLMESVGMTSEKTHHRMIEHAKSKGAKTDIEIFDIIKNMVSPPQQDQMFQENQQFQFFNQQINKESS